MPRPIAPPRLYLRTRRDGAAQWIILDAGRQIATGASAHDRRKAEKALESYLGRKHKPDFGDGHPARVAIADALAAYSEKHAPTTRRADLIGGAALKLADFFGGKTAAAITATACIDYVAWRSAQKDSRTKDAHKRVSVSTARRELVVLSAALRWCWKQGLLDRPIPVTLPPQPAPRERHLTRAEAAQLLWGALGWDADGKRHAFRINRHLARFILLGLYTGTRHDAILRLQWMPNTIGGWIDLKAGVLYRRPIGAVERGKRRPPASHPAATVAAPAALAKAHRTAPDRMAGIAHCLTGTPGVAARPRACRPRRRRYPTCAPTHRRHVAIATRRLGLRRRRRPRLL
jgi:integrase